VADAGRGDAKQLAEGIAWHAVIINQQEVMTNARRGIMIYQSSARLTSEVQSMRPIYVSVISLVVVLAATAQNKLNTRYNIDVDGISYPQSTPKEALASVVKAIRDQRINYMLAHLSDPDFVDQRVQSVHAGKFDELVKEVSGKLLNDPAAVKLLERFVQEGKWDNSDNNATATLKDARDKVFLRRAEFRWFLENKKNTDKDEKKDEK